ncbi:MAG: AI-2E family transporter [bacterium]|nr:AI-2E family transporter [bacterium]
MIKNKLNYKLLNILMIGIIAYLGIITYPVWGSLLSKIFGILLPFIISFAIAYALYPIVRKLEEKGVREKIAIGSVIIAVFCIIILLFSITVPLVYEQLISLSKILGDVINRFSTRFEINLGSFSDTINEILNKLISNVGNYISNGTIDILSRSINFITNFIIIVITSIYLLIDMKKIRKRIKAFLKNRNHRAFEYFKALDHELENYLLGLVIFMGIQLVEYSVIFAIVGHPNWLLLGILASLTTVIPYFGGLVTNIIAVILASAVSTKLFIATTIICLVFPNIDGYIISPKVYGKTNNVSPILSIFAVFAGGALYGFLGIVIALPVCLLIKCSYNFFKKDIYGKLTI